MEATLWNISKAICSTKTTYASKVIVRGRPNIVGPSVRKPIMYFHTAKPDKSRRVINISHTRKTAIIVCSFGTRIPKSSSGVTIFTTRSISNKDQLLYAIVGDSYRSFDFQVGLRENIRIKYYVAPKIGRTAYKGVLSCSHPPISVITSHKIRSFYSLTAVVRPDQSFISWSHTSLTRITIQPRSVTRIYAQSTFILSS